jgi:hypothetical protein
MKQKLLFLTLAVFISFPVLGQTVLWQEDFETDGNGSRYNVAGEFYVGVDDYFGRIYGSKLVYGNPFTNDDIELSGTDIIAQNGNYTNYNGDFYMAGEDQDNAAGDSVDEKILTFSVDISTGDILTFKGLFAAGNEGGCDPILGYDSTDYIKVTYNVDGAGDVLALQFLSNVGCTIPGDNSEHDLYNDPNLNNDVSDDGILMTNVLQEFTFGFPNGNNVVITIETHMDSGEEEYAYDFFRIEAQNTLSVAESDFMNSITVSPNPSNGVINLTKPSGLDLQLLAVYNVLGKQVKSVNLETMSDSKAIDLSALASGLYLMNIESSNGNAITKKIIIK